MILRIGKDISSGGANSEDHDDGGVTMALIKSSNLEKKKEKNKMGSRQR